MPITRKSASRKIKGSERANLAVLSRSVNDIKRNISVGKRSQYLKIIAQAPPDQHLAESVRVILESFATH